VASFWRPKTGVQEWTLESSTVRLSSKVFKEEEACILYIDSILNYANHDNLKPKEVNQIDME